jgi:phosphohistidine phosphatase
MWIYLLRHGVAEDHRAGVRDEERALTAAGERQLAAAAAAWRRVVRAPDVVFTSPLLRARQTADALCDALAHRPERRVTDAMLPGAAAGEMVRLLEAELFAKTPSVALVGHEPHLGCVLGALLASQPRLAVPLQRGMLVGLQAEGATCLVAGLRFALSQEAAASLT